MEDPNFAELAAMEAASIAAGDLIESYGRTDMAQWKNEEWSRFIATVCGAYVDALISQQIDANEAVAKVRVA